MSKLRPFKLLNLNHTFLYTFFFGYTAHRWRRLIRTLLLLPYTLFLMVFIWEVLFYISKPSEYYEGVIEFWMVILPLPCIGLISWLFKPFLVKHKEKW